MELHHGTTTTIVIGNPGVGKSTLLNCLLGAPLFKSGVSFEGGLTQATQMHQAPDGNVFVDTPGLSGAHGIAAQEIERRLKNGGAYKIFFVVVLKLGRVSPDDVKTIELILDAAPQIQSNYSVIINKVPMRLAQGGFEWSQIYRAFTTSQNSTPPPIFCNILQPELQDAENCIVPLDPQLLQFLNNSPQVIISPDLIQHISRNSFEKRHEELSSQLSIARDSNAALNDMIVNQRAQLTQLGLQHERVLTGLQEQRQQERDMYINDRQREQDAYDNERMRKDDEYYFIERARREEHLKWYHSPGAYCKYNNEFNNMIEQHEHEYYKLLERQRMERARYDREREKRKEKRYVDRQRVVERMDLEWGELQAQCSRHLEAVEQQRHEA